MGRTALLLLPLGLAITALGTGHVLAKMGVPVSCALILLWASGQAPTWRRNAGWVVAALCLSAAGDWFLSHKGEHEPYFIAGIALFFGAHLGYLAFACRQGRLQRGVLGILLLLYLPYYVFWLRPAIPRPGLALAVLLYLLISCVVFSAAWGLRLRPEFKWPYVTGIGLIVLSDTIISVTEFLGWGRWNWLILPTYYLAQLCVSWTVLAQVPTEASDRSLDGPRPPGGPGLSKAAGGLVLLALLAAAWTGYTRLWKEDRTTLGGLVGDLRPPMPWHSRWTERWLDPKSRVRAYLPKSWITKALRDDMDMGQRRGRAESKLKAMGTNAWPAVPALVKMLEDKDFSTALVAGRVLASLKAEEHPAWAGLAQRLEGQPRPGGIFRTLLSGRDEFGRRYDLGQRRFALLGLAAIGPTAGKAIPEVIEVLKTKEEHPLWMPAMASLRRLGGHVLEVVPFQKRMLQDTEEWPTLRAAAAQALAAAGPEYPEAGNLLRQALQDEKALVRVTAARELWRLNTLPDEVLPTLTVLLTHKLFTIRSNALNAIAELGSAAQPIRSEVARLTSDDHEAVRQTAVKALASISAQTTPLPGSAAQSNQRPVKGRPVGNPNRTR